MLQGFGCEALASLLSGFRRHRYAPSKPQFSALFRSLFPRRATALGSSGGHLGWLRPGRALAALVLAAGLWRVFLVGFEGTVRHPASLNVRLFFGPFLHAVPLRLGLAEGALAGCALAVP